MNSKNYYGLLQINITATEDDIKKAYRKLALEFHPDVNTDKNAEEKFKAINEAYAVLSDSRKRQIYDRMGNVDFIGFNNFANRPFPRGRGMGRCMGKCGGLDALFRKSAQRAKNKPPTPGYIPK